MIRAHNARDMIINLDGPEGNAFVLLGYAKKLGRQLCMDTDRIILEMQSYDDYKKLVQTFDKYFGDYVVLETESPEMLKNLES